MEERFDMKLIVKDGECKTSFERDYKGFAPTMYEFANFCFDAAKAYGFSSDLIGKYITYTDCD